MTTPPAVPLPPEVEGLLYAYGQRCHDNGAAMLGYPSSVRADRTAAAVDAGNALRTAIRAALEPKPCPKCGAYGLGPLREAAPPAEPLASVLDRVSGVAALRESIRGHDFDPPVAPELFTVEEAAEDRAWEAGAAAALTGAPRLELTRHIVCCIKCIHGDEHPSSLACRFDDGKPMPPEVSPAAPPPDGGQPVGLTKGEAMPPEGSVPSAPVAPGGSATTCDGDRAREALAQRDRALDALDELFAAFVVDNCEMVPHQVEAARVAQRVLAPRWRISRRLAEKRAQAERDARPSAAQVPGNPADATAPSGTDLLKSKRDWRVGTQVHRNLYSGPKGSGHMVGVMVGPDQEAFALAALVVEAVNARGREVEPRCRCGKWELYPDILSREGGDHIIHARESCAAAPREVGEEGCGCGMPWDRVDAYGYVACARGHQKPGQDTITLLRAALTREEERRHGLESDLAALRADLARERAATYAALTDPRQRLVARAETAEADLARVTAERDEWSERHRQQRAEIVAARDAVGAAEKDSDEAQAREAHADRLAILAAHERDEYRSALAELMGTPEGEADGRRVRRELAATEKRAAKMEGALRAEFWLRSWDDLMGEWGRQNFRRWKKVRDRRDLAAERVERTRAALRGGKGPDGR